MNAGKSGWYVEPVGPVLIRAYARFRQEEK